MRVIIIEKLMLPIIYAATAVSKKGNNISENGISVPPNFWHI
jgi:hypothetical protein